MEMPPDSPEEIFMVLFSLECARSSDHTPILTRTYAMSRYAMNVTWLKFSWFLLLLLPVGQQKPRKFVTHENFLLYEVHCTFR